MTGSRALLCDQVAAVPYRIEDGQLSFLLVRTINDNPRWTFPKGDPDHGSDSESAAAEAREEAGVSGVVEREPFTSYTWTKSGEKILIAAFLLRAEAEGLERSPYDQKHGEPKWCSAKEATRRFDERSELARVVDEAVKRIGGL